ncbi:TIGR02453 family protein [Paracraurococcus ruber]|nr:TIGR02453 family protein [Paracraurococcus ruber]
MPRPPARRPPRAATEEGLPPPPFEGIPADGFAFLAELAASQDRDWYAANRARWELGLRDPLAALLAAVADRCAAARLPLRFDARRGLFRLHRDTRFARDKRPFKTNAGGLLSRDGGKDRPGLLYVHVEPGNCFTACGFWQPSPPVLGRLRAAVLEDRGAWRQARRALDGAGLALAAMDDALARLPRGCEAARGTPEEALLKQRHWILRPPLPDALLQDEAAVAPVTEFARQAAPLLRFGWAALEG